MPGLDIRSDNHLASERLNLPVVFLVCLLAVPAACETGASNPETPVVAPPTSFGEQLHAAMPQLLGEFGIEGAAVGLVESGDVTLLAGYGLADTGQAIPMTPDHVFNVASISKLITAWGVMQLAEDGALNLDSGVNEYLERWKLPDGVGPAHDVTIRRLLSHTAGISMPSVPAFRYPAPVPSLVDIAAGHYSGSVYARAGTAVEIVQPPGAGFAYSGGGYVLLQLAIEDVTGRGFADFMAEEVLEPAGMMASRYGWTESLAASMATPYLRRGREEDIFRFSALAGSALHTSARDLAEFLRAVITTAQGGGAALLSAESLATLVSPVAETGYLERELGWMALGHFVEPNATGTVAAISHSGDNAGWSARLMLDYERGNGLVVLTNSDDGGKLVRRLSCLWLVAYTSVAARQGCSDGNKGRDSGRAASYWP